MENNTALENNPAAYQKARLIHEAHESLRAANLLDERNDLDEASWGDWYDHTIPEVRDIKILAGAMEVEMARRRGEKILAEDERRGGDRKSPTYLPDQSNGLVTLISDADKMQRSRARVIANHPAAVAAYVQRQAKAGRAPSVYGAAEVATLAQAKAGPKYGAKRLEWIQKRSEQSDREMKAILDQLADGVRRSDRQLIKITGNADLDRNFLRPVRLLPWLTIDRTAEGTIFKIDEPLRAICEGKRPRPELEFKSISDYLCNLRAEITRRRKNNHDEFMKRRWDSLPISKREQTELLDWIEQQLDRLPTL
jgi:hypothetical protein